MDAILKHKWYIWYHKDKDNWTISGFEKIYEIINVNDFWKLYNSWNKIFNNINKHIFIMREGINPIWEDPNNINGGCWSFKVANDVLANELWEDLSIYIVTNNLSNDNSDEIFGLSMIHKKNNNCIIKIWNKDCNKNSLNLLNKNILNKWGTNIIYIAHIQLN